MEIKAADVKKLRKAKNAGMMDCKHALQEAEGDFDKAVDICLLYTSPSPRDRQKSRMPSSA